MDEIEREYLELLRATRALIAWEREVADVGFPDVDVSAPRLSASSPQPAAEGIGQASERAPQTASKPPLPASASPSSASSEPKAPPSPGAPQAVANAPASPSDPARAPTPHPSAGRGAPTPTQRPQLSVLEEKRREVETCRACALAEGRQKTVFSRGREDAQLMFIGEGPGEKEDLSGLPFVGPAGQLLDRMIQAMGYARDEVYICNVVKCRPPKNRAPRPDEVEACRHFLDAQIEAVAPELIIVLGRSAAEALRVIDDHGQWRGRFGTYRGRTTLATYHPSFLLRSPEQKRVAWSDLKKALTFLGRPIPR